MMQELIVIQDIDAGDKQLIQMWLHERPANTQAAYLRDVENLLRFIAPRPLRTLTLLDLQAFSDSLADTSRARQLSAAKSLLTFAHRTGYIQVNVGAALRLPKIREQLAGLCWLLEASAENMESLISSVTSSLNTSHASKAQS